MPAAKNPVITAMFALEVQGISKAFFKEASGFNSESEVVELRQVNDKGVEVINKIPGRTKWDNITLRRGTTDNMDLWKWRKLVLDGNVHQARKEGSVVMYDQDFTEVARFNFRGGWPSVWKGADLKADDNAVAIEEIVITHEGLERVL
jgi:phage tail-like protein